MADVSDYLEESASTPEWNDSVENDRLEDDFRAFVQATYDGSVFDDAQRLRIVSAIAQGFRDPALQEVTGSVIERLITVGDEPTRAQLIAQIRSIVEETVMPADETATDTIALLSSHMLRLLSDDSEQIRSAVRHMIELLLSEDAPPEVSRVVEKVVMHHMDELEGNMQRMGIGDSSAEFYLLEFLILTPSLTRALTRLSNAAAMEDTMLPRLETLCSSSNFRVRKGCALVLPDVSALVSSVGASKILSLFLKISTDEIWGVRKVCAERLPAMSASTAPDSRNTVITQCFVQLAQDESRWVRCAVFKSLGSLIATFVSAPPDNDELRQRSAIEAATRQVAAPVSTLGSDEIPSANEGSKARFVALPDAPIGESETNGDSDADGTASAEHEDAFVDLPTFDVATKGRRNTRRVSPAPWDLQRLASFLQDEEQNAGPQPDDVFDEETIVEESESEGAVAANTQLDVVSPDHDEDTSRNTVDETCDLPLTSFTYWRLPVQDVDDELLRLFDLTDTTDKGAAGDVTANHCSDAAVEDSPISQVPGDVQDELRPDVPHVGRDEGAANLPPLPIPSELISHFNMMSEQTSSRTIDSDITRSCAYTIPAVVWALGREHWSLVRQTYTDMASNLDWRIRATLAHSCHVCAMILGQEITEKDLLTVYLGFLWDWEEVKDAAMGCFADFVRVLSSGHRAEFLDAFLRLSKANEKNNWRRRQAVSDQLRDVLDLFPLGKIKESICTAMLDLGIDEVAAVRKSANRTLAALMNHFAVSEGDKAADNFFDDILERLMSTGRSCDRQGIVHVANGMINVAPPALFSRIVLPRLLNLANDTVPNVRLVLAQCLTNLLRSSFLEHDETAETKILQALGRLGDDPDPDVALCSTVPRRNSLALRAH